MSRISAPRGSFGYAQDRLFDSAPSAVPRDKSVRRFAQDDDFVGGLKKNTPNRLMLVGLASWARFSHTPSKSDFSVGQFGQHLRGWGRDCLTKGTGLAVP